MDSITTLSHRRSPAPRDEFGDTFGAEFNRDTYANIPRRFGKSLITSSELIKLLDEPSAVIAVKDLEASAFVGDDAWGANDAAQKVQISVSISLRHPFRSASEHDNITADTIHYGRIKKTIAFAVAYFNENAETRNGKTLGCLISVLAWAFSQAKREETISLTGELAKSSEITIMLPKASARGTGVSLTLTGVHYEHRQADGNREHCSLTLKCHDIKVPTLIGLLPKERLAKQNVIANIMVDVWQYRKNCYNDLEQMAVKTMEESSFGTIEALADQICTRLIRYVIIPVVVRHIADAIGLDSLDDDHEELKLAKFELRSLVPRVRVKLEKPHIYDNTVPSVEMLVDALPGKDPTVLKLWRNYKTLKRPPFPLQGSLSSWIAENSPDDI